MDGSRISSCRMYESWTEIRDGYTKSLWAAFGSPAGAGAVVLLLLFGYVLPLLVALINPLAGLLGYLLGVAGRVLTARATGTRTWPDVLTHPLSVVLFAALVIRSYHLHRRGRIRWKGRSLDTGRVADSGRIGGRTGWRKR
jgi:hypothetical protein